MIDGKKVLALITARSGSKGVPNKNVKPLAGKPLILWTIEPALKSDYVDRLIVSTDSENIAAVAASGGCEVPFLRPDHLATDICGSMEVIIHALDNIAEKYDYLLLLQPTSPFRKKQDIDEIIEYCVGLQAEAVVSVSEVKHPMFLFYTEGGVLRRFFKSGDRQIRRQDMPSAYEHNGALYLSTIDFLYKNKSYMAENVFPYVTSGDINVDIDTFEDWRYAEYIAKDKIGAI